MPNCPHISKSAIWFSPRLLLSRQLSDRAHRALSADSALIFKLPLAHTLSPSCASSAHLSRISAIR